MARQRRNDPPAEATLPTDRIGMWVRVLSSNVNAIMYAPADRGVRARLWVRFHSGAIYCYFGPDIQTWRDFLSAPSKGRFVWQRLRDKYPFNRIAGPSR